ncbi:hypothetical protein [Magnetococcus sp. PR-3]|uniref:hypothetical protein n=1 Tax=Magnetococcus sp. PR-3 TaxID=3120355 RepID=UPI002FCE2AF5
MGTIEEVLERAAAPTVEFWDNELEIGLQHILPELESKQSMAAWVDKLTGRQLAMLCRCTHTITRDTLPARREALKALGDVLSPYRLVDLFAYRKSKVAVTDYAMATLDQRTLRDCHINDTTYDTKSLLFALFSHDSHGLKDVFLLDKLQKSGFACMRLSGPTDRKHDMSFEAFMEPERIRETLAAYDLKKDDQRSCDYKGMLVEDGRPMLFIRRAEKPSKIVQKVGIVHGFHPEWIILDFEANARGIRISSSSPAVPLEIANQVASAYFRQSCRYENLKLGDDESQIKRFFEQLVRGTPYGLSLVELQLYASPFKGEGKLRLRDEKSISRPVAHLQQVFGNIFTPFDNIDYIQVLYQGKRVRMQFDSILGCDDMFTVRYSDQPLSIRERVAFEKLLSSRFGFHMLSIEKKHRS